MRFKMFTRVGREFDTSFQDNKNPGQGSGVNLVGWAKLVKSVSRRNEKRKTWKQMASCGWLRSRKIQMLKKESRTDTYVERLRGTVERGNGIQWNLSKRTTFFQNCWKMAETCLLLRNFHLPGPNRTGPQNFAWRRRNVTCLSGPRKNPAFVSFVMTRFTCNLHRISPFACRHNREANEGRPASGLFCLSPLQILNAASHRIAMSQCDNQSIIWVSIWFEWASPKKIKNTAMNRIKNQGTTAINYWRERQ